ncbi:ATP-binding protein [Fibrisoma montanum]|uniref:ATP-binding protein n=1 Tax=Fibrisoma montanum TaxID=2305895 RepID=A0A418M154_9BACT|nr:ATP-binding protein [Fibrisoma montanum]RIV19397.1 ATP-binding protein [Fibrisoma montanum]
MISDTSTDTNDHSSVFSKGGGGTVFEQSVQTAFVTTLLVRGKVPGLPTGEITEVAFQTTRLGFCTDDLLVKVRSHQGEHQLLAQVKHNLTISVKNKTFEEVMTAFWQDFTNASVFNPVFDRLLVIKSEMTQVDKRDTVVLLNWAKSKASADDFYQEVKRIDSKVQVLKVLSDVLQKANNGQVVDQERVWQFLRCLVILEYDFGQESSNSETNFLNLIRLAKNQTVTVSEKEIWTAVYAFVARLNKDGGSVTLNSLQTELFATYFDPVRLHDSYAAIKKLQEDSQAIIGPLKNTIANLHLDRSLLRDKLTEHINDHKFTIIIGEPGAGKSALVKEVLLDSTPDTVALTFKADQFNQSHLSQVFSGLGVSDGLVQLSACLSAIPKKIVAIDSFEKLLEGDSDNAFRQFMHILEGVKDVRVVATSRIYAVDLLIQKYALTNVSVLEVPLLTEGEDGEFEQVLVAFPQLHPLAANPKIRQVLRSPKYLDYTVQWVSKTTDNVNELTLTDFKNRLWQHIVENHVVIRNGMPAKRSKAFIEIALRRAQRMVLYAEPDQADAAAIDELVNDNVLTKQANEHKYTPSHDILEDWALAKHIRQLWENHVEPEAFYQHIGNKPALRRAFRLWTEDMLRQQPGIIFQLVRDTRQQATIEPYWADEVLIAIFRSDDSAAFFTEFESELLQDQAQFLQRALHLLRTACKERRPGNNSTFLYPVGSGWEAALSFVQQHLAQLDSLQTLVIGLLIDWSYNLQLSSSKDLSTNEIRTVKNILFTYLARIENNAENWRKEPLKGKVNALIDVAFELTQYAQEEVHTLLQRAMPGPNDRYEHHPRSFYGHIRKMALSGIYSRPLTRFLPDQVIAMARAVWVRKERPKVNHSLLGEDYEADHDWFDQGKLYGLESHLHANPPGIYKTPILDLLLFSRQHGLDFVLEMVNYCTGQYVRSARAKDDVPIQVDVVLPDGSVTQQWGNQVLWQAYRATVVSSDLLESILMSLEKYLFDTAALKTDVSRNSLRQMFAYLLRRSNSVAISSVLVSIAMAYPEEVGEAMLPLLGTREFYQWDVRRSLDDRAGALAVVDFEIEFAQQERINSNQLPHRKHYAGGLSEFVRHMQFNVRTLNKAIHEQFDRLKQEAQGEDVHWRKLLNEIDSRQWELRDYDEALGGFIVEPNYEPDVQVIVDEYKPRQEWVDQAWKDTTWIGNVHGKKNGVVADYELWKTIFDRYYSTDSFDKMYDRPVMLAIIGLRDLNSKLTEEQRKWCFEVVFVVVESLIQVVEGQRYHIDYELSVSPFEYEPALTSLPILLKVADEHEVQQMVIRLLFQVLITYFPNHKMEPILASLREQLWEIDTSVANHVWQSLIGFAQLRKFHEKDELRLYHDEELQRQVAKAEEEFIIEVALGQASSDINYEQISLTTWDSHLLTRAVMMLPFNTQEERHLSYKKLFILLFLKGLDKEDNQDEWLNRRPLIYDGDRISLQQWFRDYLLHCNHEGGADVLERLFQQLLSTKFHGSNSYEFVQLTLRMMISELGQIVYNNPEPLAKQVTANFWRIWERFYIINKRAGKRLFSDLLFLDIIWEEAWTHWIPLEGKRAFFKRITDDFGQHDVRPLVKLLSTVGDQTLLPDGLRWVVNIVKKYPTNLSALSHSSAEKLINRLYQRYINVLRNEVSLLNDFVWLLDQMTDLGSSQAYITRENLITYKSQTS